MRDVWFFLPINLPPTPLGSGAQDSVFFSTLFSIFFETYALVPALVRIGGLPALVQE
jgi:hypothetical protein